MKEKIFNALKQAYSNLGLGDEILQAHAESLANLGLVTDENLQNVISTQKTFLEGLQKQNDRRVTEATEKARNKAKAEFEAEAKKAADEAKKKAEEEARKKAETEAERKRQEEIEKSAASEELKKILKQRDEESKSMREEFQKFIEEQRKTQEEITKKYELLQQESETLRAEQAKNKREKFILSKAKELEIPEWRIEEGFALTDKDDESSITEKLTKIANNVKANKLPSDKRLPLGDDKPSDEEINAVVKTLIK